MKTKKLRFGFLPFAFFLPLFLFAQEKIIVMNFDGDQLGEEFEFCQTDQINYKSSWETQCSDCIKSGVGSKKFKWNFNSGEYCGWGIGLKKVRTGYDLRSKNIKYLSFWLRRSNNENFQIKVKDTSNEEVTILSIRYINPSMTDWQLVRIPITDFGTEINLSSIDNINFGFNSTYSSEGENMVWIDEIVFEK